jgi:hypothetical protein
MAFSRGLNLQEIFGVDKNGLKEFLREVLQEVLEQEMTDALGAAAGAAAPETGYCGPDGRP